MSSISVRIEGDTDRLLAKLKSMENVDKAGIMNAIGEGIRTSTMERFRKQESPEGKKWKPSIRALETGDNTLILSRKLSTKINVKSNSSGAAVGTNLIYAATHQFGAERTIRAKNGKYLRFKVGGKWASVPSVHVRIPARPFLGVSKEDEEEIRDILNEVFEE